MNDGKTRHDCYFDIVREFGTGFKWILGKRGSEIAESTARYRTRQECVEAIREAKRCAAEADVPDLSIPSEALDQRFASLEAKIDRLLEDRARG